MRDSESRSPFDRSARLTWRELCAAGAVLASCVTTYAVTQERVAVVEKKLDRVEAALNELATIRVDMASMKTDVVWIKENLPRERRSP